jgi:hypothetical protein
LGVILLDESKEITHPTTGKSLGFTHSDMCYSTTLR